MTNRQKIIALMLVALLVAAAYGLRRTTPPAVSSSKDAIDTNPEVQSGLIDQTSLATAQRLASIATGEDEQPLAQEALRLADHEVDLAFAAALRSAAEHPPVLGPEARELQAHLLEAKATLEKDKLQIEALTAAEAKAVNERKISAADELEIAKAQLELDQDEVEDAKQDLMRAGGDPQGRIQAMVQEHEATLHEMPPISGNNDNALQAGGLIHRLQQFSILRQKELRLRQAQQDSLAAAASLSAKHDALVTQVAEKKTSAGSPTARTHEQAKVVVKSTKERSAQQNELSTFDKRIESYKNLANSYEKWRAIVHAKKQVRLRLAMWGATIILSILLVGLLFNTWMERLLGTMPLARRQVDTLRSVARLALQIFSVLLVLLVIFGPPRELGTFLGLAGAGLTVALKDFIVSFVGWFVLMGKNGIRLGDWVEINGVSGEVVELGMFHTVLLETGNWTDSGHPTGRRVTFTNSFAIEGHYFNFSTSGQWLWDELQIVLPAGKDPFPIVEAIQKKVLEATSESARLAEKEWQHAALSRDMSALSAAPAINVRPVIAGVELGVRYITRASERYQIRAKLYGVAMDLLAAKQLPAASVSTNPPGPINKEKAVAEPELVHSKT